MYLRSHSFMYLRSHSRRAAAEAPCPHRNNWTLDLDAFEEAEFQQQLEVDKAPARGRRRPVICGNLPPVGESPSSPLPLRASSSSEKSSRSVCHPEEESDSASECSQDSSSSEGSQDSSSSEFFDNANEPCCKEVRDYLDYVEACGYGPHCLPFREYCQRFGVLEDWEWSEESDSASECSQDSSSSEFLDNDNEPCCREVRDYLDYVEEGGYVPFREYCQRFGILEDYIRDFDSVA